MGKQSDDENGQLHYKMILNIALALAYSISRMLKSLHNIFAITVLLVGGEGGMQTASPAKGVIAL